MKLNKNFEPSPIPAEEVYGGFLQFNISAIISDISSKKLIAQQKRIYLKQWFEEHSADFSVINKKHLKSVDLSTPVIQAEMRINRYEIIDGNHRMKKALDDGRTYINSYQISGEQLANYLLNKEQYESYVRYWNEKIENYIEDMV
ncbi:hypothetical protein [Sulfurimonas sp. NW9]|uniref:hypothetical protein n=1 Tax=Sulfurimonas sp. NW9 TaxID=2922728 RepID=UPI003DA8E948